MSTPPSPGSPQKDSAPSQDLLEGFRAHLHLVVTAGQTGRSAAFRSLLRPKFQDYCRAIAKYPENPLAGELGAAVGAILEEIRQLSGACERALQQKKFEDAQAQAELERVLAQLDFSLALILRRLTSFARHRAEVTQCRDLLHETIWSSGVGENRTLAKLLRRHKTMCPDEYEAPELQNHSGNSYLFSFAWATYQQVEELQRLALEFPEHIRAAARRMHGWPMLMHRHTHNRREFSALARKLEVGEDYPTDATEAARFRPDTPMVRYLDPLIRRIHIMCAELGDIELQSTEDERSMLLYLWWWSEDESPGDEELAALRAARSLPPLTKGTAVQWAEKAMVPLILATDARDWRNCTEPVLQRIANQKGVKSRATFKSRLLAAVSATLRRLARSK